MFELVRGLLDIVYPIMCVPSIFSLVLRRPIVSCKSGPSRFMGSIFVGDDEYDIGNPLLCTLLLDYFTASVRLSFMGCVRAEAVD